MSTSGRRPSFFTSSESDGILTVTFHREQLTDEDNIEQMGEELFALVDKAQHRKIILNMSFVRFVTSSVLGKWISLHRKVARSEGKLVFCDVQPDLQVILEASQLITYFQVVKTLDEARAALAG